MLTLVCTYSMCYNVKHSWTQEHVTLILHVLQQQQLDSRLCHIEHLSQLIWVTLSLMSSLTQLYVTSKDDLPSQSLGWYKAENESKSWFRGFSRHPARKQIRPILQPLAPTQDDYSWVTNKQFNNDTGAPWPVSEICTSLTAFKLFSFDLFVIMFLCSSWKINMMLILYWTSGLMRGLHTNQSLGSSTDTEYSSMVHATADKSPV